MVVYKLTNQQNETYNGTKWGENVTHKTNGEGDLCGPGWLHYYSDPLLAVFLNPIHANISNPKLWECEASGKFKDDLGRKGGCTQLTTIREIPLPIITTDQKVEIAIRISLEVYREAGYVKWAEKWLSGEDRTATAAAYAAAAVDANAAAYSATYAATYAATAAAYAAAAVDAVRAAYAANANAATYAATYAATAAAANLQHRTGFSILAMIKAVLRVS